MTLLFTYLLPLLLPTAVYMLWRLWRARSVAAAKPVSEGPAGEGIDGSGPASLGQEIDWRDAPWLMLALAGVALLSAVLLIGALSHRSGPPERYVPPRLEDGRIVPGELRPETAETGRPDVEKPNDPAGASGP